MKLELRNLDQIDPSQLAYHANDPLVGRYLRNSFPYPYTLDHALSFINFSIENKTLDLGIVVDDICIGCIGVTFRNDIYAKNCEIGYWIGRDYWGKTITTKVVKLLCQHLFENYSLNKICAEVYDENKSSASVLERNGFEQEGVLKDHVYKDGQYYDVILYGLRRCLYEDKKVK